MTTPLAAPTTALDRLQQAIGRMVGKHGFQRLAPTEAENFLPPGAAVLLLTDDPQRNPEVLDACVILPEALKGASVARWVADADASRTLLPRFGIARAPAVVFLRDGDYLGALSGIRNWSEYLEEVARLLAGPPRPRPIGVPVRAAGAPGGCP